MLILGMSFKLNPTIKEINKYLSKAVDELLEKHQKVSHPDFEKELQERTGIAWKQVKNYKNHPKPSQRIRDNAKVLPYILECRKSDTKRKLIRSTLIALGSLAIVMVFVIVIKAVLYPRNTVVIVQQTESGIEIPINTIPNATTFKVPTKNWILSLGVPTKDQIDLSQFICKRTLLLLNSCRYLYNEADDHLEVVLLFQGDFLRGYTIYSTKFGGKIAQEIYNQLKEKPFFNKSDNEIENRGHRIIRVSSKTEGEEIDFMTSKNGPNKSINAVSVTVSAKLLP